MEVNDTGVVRGKGFEPSNPYGTGSSSLRLKSVTRTFDQAQPPPHDFNIIWGL